MRRGISKRSVLMGSGALVVAGTALGDPSHAQQRDPIAQPETPGPEAFMARAFDMQRLASDKGDQAYGAVIVRDGIIVGQSWSRVVLDTDPTGHAEISAIRDAAARLASRSLAGCTLYSSSRPCPMCEAAAYWAGIAAMVHGRELSDAGGPQLCRGDRG